MALASLKENENFLNSKWHMLSWSKLKFEPMLFSNKTPISVADPGFSQSGAPTLGAGGAVIKFNFFLRKLHEIEKNLAARRGRVPGAPP